MQRSLSLSTVAHPSARVKIRPDPGFEAQFDPENEEDEDSDKEELAQQLTWENNNVNKQLHQVYLFFELCF